MAHTRAATAGLVLFAAFRVARCQPMVFAVDFGRYPGYDGSMALSGSVAIVGHKTGGVQQLLWDLSGLDASCVPGAGDAIANACGLHVHAGATCDSSNEVGGHFFNASQDPWLDIVYVSDSDGRSVGSAVVATGFDVSDFAGRAFVVHELANGGRAACGILAAAASVSSARFSRYPGYAGDLAVSGSVTLAAAGGSAQLLTWELSGLDVACDGLHAADNVTNGCGMHVHAGSSCEDASLVGGHLFATQFDPWLGVAYVADRSGASRGVALVDAGVSLSDIAGKPFVVHELAIGGRASCALLGESGLLRAGSLGPYPGHSGALDVAGSVVISPGSAPGRQLVAWDLRGVDEACHASAGDGIANGCGIHVHAGATCAEAALVGGHLFAAGSDPWLDVVYVSDSFGRSTGSAEVNTGLGLAALAGRALVVHRRDSGARVACGILSAAESVSTDAFSPYPGYTGDLRVDGRVTLSVAGPNSQLVSWDLAGLDVACSTEGVADDVPNGCGIHVHAGKTCADEESVGGHLFGGGLSQDPWADVRFVADSDGSSSASAVVDTGLPLSDMVGRALVVHRLRDGGRVACAVLETALTLGPSAPAPAPAPPTPAPAPSTSRPELEGRVESSGGSGLAVRAASLGVVALVLLPL